MVLKSDSIETAQGWIRKWDCLSLLSVNHGKALEYAYIKKGYRLTKVKLPPGEWKCDLKGFMRNRQGQEFLLVYALEFRQEFLLMVKGDVERFIIHKNRKLEEIEVDMEILPWADSVYLDGRKRFVRRWDAILYANQEGDEYSIGWMTQEIRSIRARQAGLFDRGVIGTQQFDFFRNKVDSTFWIGFTEGMGRKRYYYPIDSLSNFRISIKRNERPFWSNRFKNWSLSNQKAMRINDVILVSESKVEFLSCQEGTFKFLFRIAVVSNVARPVRISEREIRENFIEGTFRLHRFYEVDMNGRPVQVIEVLGKKKMEGLFESPLVGYLLLEEGFEKEVDIESNK
jgi:hypothetical protein